MRKAIGKVEVFLLGVLVNLIVPKDIQHLSKNVEAVYLFRRKVIEDFERRRTMPKGVERDALTLRLNICMKSPLFKEELGRNKLTEKGDL